MYERPKKQPRNGLACFSSRVLKKKRRKKKPGFLQSERLRKLLFVLKEPQSFSSYSPRKKVAKQQRQPEFMATKLFFSLASIQRFFLIVVHNTYSWILIIVNQRYLWSWGTLSSWLCEIFFEPASQINQRRRSVMHIFSYLFLWKLRVIAVNAKRKEFVGNKKSGRMGS